MIYLQLALTKLSVFCNNLGNICLTLLCSCFCLLVDIVCIRNIIIFPLEIWAYLKTTFVKIQESSSVPSRDKLRIISPEITTLKWLLLGDLMGALEERHREDYTFANRGRNLPFCRGQFAAVVSYPGQDPTA